MELNLEHKKVLVDQGLMWLDTKPVASKEIVGGIFKVKDLKKHFNRFEDFVKAKGDADTYDYLRSADKQFF